jgi:hypothetical protein
MTDAETKAARRYGFDAMTVSCYQGSEHHTVQIMIHGTFLSMGTDSLLMTAATRATHNIVLILGLTPQELTTVGRLPLLAALLDSGPDVKYEDMFRQELAPYEIVRMPEDQRAAIAAARAVTARASGAVYDRAPPQLLVHLTNLEFTAPPDPKPSEGDAVELRPRTHLPRADPTGLVDGIVGEAKPREERELKDATGMSLLFEERADDPLNTAALFPKQQARDGVLRNATIRKRLAAGSADENKADLAARAVQASVLFAALLDIAELPAEGPAFDPETFQECVYENEFVKLTKKTQATLANNVDRADPDWKLKFVEHFIKSQLKAKTESLGIDGKPGQTIATCSDLVVLLFGPMVRYMRRKIMAKLPDNIFCNCGKSQMDQSRWSRKYWRDKRSTASDYNSFDAAQRGDSIGLEYKLMRYLNFDSRYSLAFELYRHDAADLPDLYLDWKLDTRSNLGFVKRSGRDTGEPGTYDFNTYFNLALIRLMYGRRPGLPLAVGGDDMAANAVLTPTARWLRIAPGFLVTAKVEHTTRPEFCGYFLTSRGCFRNPRLLMFKTLWHVAKGDAAAVDVNYAAEAWTAYAFGDLLTEHCSFDELACLGWLIEYYHQARPDLARTFFSLDPGLLPGAELPAPVADFEVEHSGLTRAQQRFARQTNTLAQRVAAVTGLNFSGVQSQDNHHQ